MNGIDIGGKAPVPIRGTGAVSIYENKRDSHR